jgi:hypothetical protein
MGNNMLPGLKKLLTLAVLIFALLGCNEDINFAPVVEILAPLDNSILDETFVVEVNATADAGIENVELYLNNTLIGKADNEPYHFTVNITGYNSGNYTVKAIAYSRSGKSSSKEILVTIVKPTLDKPLELVVSKGEYGNKITLKWNDSPGAAFYQVFKQNNSSKEYIKLATVDKNSFEDLSIEAPLTQYFYKVRAYNSETVYGDFSEYDYGYANGKPYDLVRSFGMEGTQINQFGLVTHIAYKNNELYVADDYNERIVKYSKDGTVLGLFNSCLYPTAPHFFGDKLIISCREAGTITIQNGTGILSSIQTSQLDINQLTVDNNNFIYAAASHSNTVTKYDMDGNLVLQWGTKGNAQGEFNGVWGIAYYNDNIVVSNYFSKKVQFFSKNGEFIKEWLFDSFCFDIFVKDNFLYVACGGYIVKTDYEGVLVEKIYGNFTFASSVVLDENNDLFITDPYQRKIYVYRKAN